MIIVQGPLEMDFYLFTSRIAWGQSAVKSERSAYHPHES